MIATKLPAVTPRLEELARIYPFTVVELRDAKVLGRLTDFGVLLLAERALRVGLSPYTLASMRYDPSSGGALYAKKDLFLEAQILYHGCVR